MVNKKLVTKLAFVLMVAVTFFAACATAPKSNKMDMKDYMKSDMNMKDKDMKVDMMKSDMNMKDKDMKSDMNMKDDMKSDMMKDGKKK